MLSIRLSDINVYGNYLQPETSNFNYNNLFKFRMLSRYMKIEADSRFSTAEDRGRYFVSGDYAVKLMSFIFFYLLLPSFIYKASGACES